MDTTPMHTAYYGLLAELLSNDVTEENARTGVRIRALRGGHSFKLDLSDGLLPMVGNRRYYPHVAAAEVAWQFMGTRDPKFILRHAPKLWSKFLEKETYTTNNVEARRDVLKTAYGYRWREHFGRDQLLLAIQELRDNPTNRQLWVQAWDPRSDGLGGPQPKNVPCPVGFSVSRFGNELHMSVFIRSSDVFVGLPYDVMGYALTLDAIAASVDCRPGTLHVTLAHPHLYEPHWDMAAACLFGLGHVGRATLEKECDRYADAGTPDDWADTRLGLPAWSVSEILANSEGYVSQVRRLARRATLSGWDPLPELIE